MDQPPAVEEEKGFLPVEAVIEPAVEMRSRPAALGKTPAAEATVVEEMRLPELEAETLRPESEAEVKQPPEAEVK